MARTLQFTGELNWPLEDGKQAAKLPLSMSLGYTSVLHLEKVFAAPVVDEAVTLPMASAKFLLLQANTEDLDVKINGSTTPITLKAGTGFLLVWNEDGAITSLSISAATVPATLKGYVFA